VGHRGGVDIDPNHPPRDLRQQGRSVSFAAGYIEDILATAPVSRKQIPVEVLDLDLSMRGGGPPFTGKFQRSRRRFLTKYFTHVLGY